MSEAVQEASEELTKPFALITGACGGIGQALVLAFREAGYEVIGTDINPKPEDLAIDHFLQIDLQKTVLNKTYAETVFNDIKKIVKGQGLRVLINNAATQILGGTEKLNRDAWRETLDVNTLAPFFWTQALLSELEKDTGSVINLSSIHAQLTKREFVAYATSKAALSGLTRALAVDLGGRIRVNAIEPAAIQTKMLEAGFEGNEDLLKELHAAHPAGKIGLPEEVASFAVWLADKTKPFLTGTVVRLDGGIGGRLYDPA